MADWFWEWQGGIENQNLYADRNGTFNKPWVLGPSRYGINPGALDWSVMAPGDTLWILDNHSWDGYTNLMTRGIYPGINIRGDYPGRPGSGIKQILFSDSDGVSFNGLTVQGGIFELSNCSDVTLDSCKFIDNSVSISAHRDSPANNWTIRDCLIDGSYSEGIQCFAQPHTARYGWVIERNEIRRVGAYGVFPNGDMEGIGIQRLRDSVIRDNHIHHCDYGINIWESGSGYTSDIEIYNNLIHDITSGPSQWPSRAIMTSGGAPVEGCFRNIRVYNNIIYNVGREGIRVQTPPNPVGLQIFSNYIANVNMEFGASNTEYITGDWKEYDNTLRKKYYPILGGSLSPMIRARRRRSR